MDQSIKRSIAVVAGLMVVAVVVGRYKVETDEFKLFALAVTASGFIVLAATWLAHWLRDVKERTKHWVMYSLIGLTVLSGVGLRLWLTGEFPLVNDEQFYVHDAILFDPTDPVFWKTPLLISSLAAWIKLTGFTSVVMLRTLIIVSSVISLALLSYAAYRVAGKHAGLGTLIVGLLLPSVLPYTSLVMTEQIMILPAIAAMTMAILYRDRVKPAWWQLLVVSLLIGIATTARWSALFWLVGVLILLRAVSIREWVRRVGWLVAPYAVALVGFITAFPSIVAGWRLGDIFIEFFEKSAEQGWLNKWAEWGSPLARISPLLAIGAVGMPVAIQSRKVLYNALSITLIVGMFALLSQEVVLPSYPPGLPWILILPGVAVVLAVWLGRVPHRRVLIDVLAFIVPPLLAYLIFHKVNPKYMAELIPGLVLLAGLGLGAVLEQLSGRRGPIAAATLLVLVWWVIPWGSFVTANPYAGTLEPRGIQAAVTYLQEHVQPGERVLTASNLIPLLAGFEPAYQISHPAWIMPTFRGQPDLRFNQLYDPMAAELRAGDIRWVITEKLTEDTYRRHAGVDEAIDQFYEPVAEFKSKTVSTITILERRP